MNLIRLAPNLLILPLCAPLPCRAAPAADDPTKGPPRSAADDLPPASISPPLDNNRNAPMEAKNATGTLGSIERLDPALDELLAPDAKVEVLVENVQWAEGPVWSNGGLFFSDVKQNKLYRWTPEAGVRVYLHPSGYTAPAPRGGEPGSNGLTLDPGGPT